MATQQQPAAARSYVKKAQAGEARKLNIERRSKMGKGRAQARGLPRSLIP